MGFHDIGFHWVLLGFHGFSRAFMVFMGFYGLLLGFHGI